MLKQICCLFGKREAEEYITYARYVSNLLGTPLSVKQPQSRREEIDPSWIKCVTGNSELVIAQSPMVSRGQRLRIGDPGNWLAQKSTSTILLARKPRWPFRRLLLILRNERSDAGAATWALRLACESDAFITILPIVPSLPNFLQISDNSQKILTNLLNSTVPLAEMLRKLLAQLEESQVRHEIQLQRGLPDWQVAQALNAGEHELLITGDEEGVWLSRWVRGEFIAPLLRWLDCPILICKSSKKEIEVIEAFQKREIVHHGFVKQLKKEEFNHPIILPNNS